MAPQIPRTPARPQMHKHRRTEIPLATITCRKCGTTLKQPRPLKQLLTFIEQAETTGWTISAGFLYCPTCSKIPQTDPHHGAPHQTKTRGGTSHQQATDPPAQSAPKRFTTE